MLFALPSRCDDEPTRSPNPSGAVFSSAALFVRRRSQVGRAPDGHNSTRSFQQWDGRKGNRAAFDARVLSLQEAARELHHEYSRVWNVLVASGVDVGSLVPANHLAPSEDVRERSFAALPRRLPGVASSPPTSPVCPSVICLQVTPPSRHQDKGNETGKKGTGNKKKIGAAEKARRAMAAERTTLKLGAQVNSGKKTQQAEHGDASKGSEDPKQASSAAASPAMSTPRQAALSDPPPAGT